MKNIKKVSVIIPIGSNKVKLEETVRSVLSQYYRLIEVILVDGQESLDCSIVGERLRVEDSRVSVVRVENNSGRFSSTVCDLLNLGLNASSGDYIIFVKSGDLLTLDMLMEMISSADMNGSDVVIPNELISKGITTGREVLQYLGKSNNDLVVRPWGKLFNSRLFDNLRFPTENNFADWYLFPRLYGKADLVSVLCDDLYTFDSETPISVYNKIEILYAGYCWLKSKGYNEYLKCIRYRLYSLFTLFLKEEGALFKSRKGRIVLKYCFNVLLC